MKKNIYISLVVLTALLLVVVFFMYRNYTRSVSGGIEEISVTSVKSIPFDSYPGVNTTAQIRWVPEANNTIAAIDAWKKNLGTIVYFYNYETGDKKAILDLAKYNIMADSGLGFFWPAQNKIMIGSQICDPAGKNQCGYKSSIFLIDKQLETSSEIVLPEGCNNPILLGATPDGNSIFFQCTSGFFYYDIQGHAVREFRITSKAFSQSFFDVLAWSPDGKWLAIKTYDPDHKPQGMQITPEAIYLFRFDGNESRLIERNIDGQIKSATFSNDSTMVLWEISRYGERVNQFGGSIKDSHIHVANVDGSSSYEIFSTGQFESNQGVTSNILWSPDGSKLIFRGNKNAKGMYVFWILSLGNLK